MSSLKISQYLIPGTQPQTDNEGIKEIKPQAFPPDCPVTSPEQKQDNDSGEENPKTMPSPDPGRIKIYFTDKSEIAYFTQIPMQTDKAENN